MNTMNTLACESSLLRSDLNLNLVVAGTVSRYTTQLLWKLHTQIYRQIYVQIDRQIDSCSRYSIQVNYTATVEATHLDIYIDICIYRQIDSCSRYIIQVNYTATVEAPHLDCRKQIDKQLNLLIDQIDIQQINILLQKNG